MMQIFAVRAAAEIERLRADEALRSSEESYRTIFEAIEDGVVIHDWHTGALVDLNPKACEMSGFRREDVLGAPLIDLLLAPTRPTRRPMRAAICSSRSEGRCPPYEWRRPQPRRQRRLGRGPPEGGRRSAACRASSRSAATSPRRRTPRRRCACARSSTGRSSRPRRTPSCCATRTSTSSTSTRRSCSSTASRASSSQCRGGYPRTSRPSYVAERRERIERALRRRGIARRDDRAAPRRHDASRPTCASSRCATAASRTCSRWCATSPSGVSASASCSAARRACARPSRRRSTASSAWTAKAGSSSSTRAAERLFGHRRERRCSAACSPT